MKFTIEQLLSLQQGLVALDSAYQRIIGEGKSAQAVSLRYDLPKQTRVDNGLRLSRIEPVLAIYNKQREELVKKYGTVVGEEFKVSPQHQIAFSEENRELLAAEVELDLPALKLDDLKLDANPVPGVVLSLLAPLIP